MSVQVLLADDHVVVRQGLRMLLEHHGYVVVAEAADGLEAVKLAEQSKPDVAVLDLAMPKLNGIDAAREVRRVSPRTRTILLTVHTEEPYVVAALRAGVCGYVLKTQTTEDLVRAIEESHAGAIYLSPRVTKAVVEAASRPDNSSVEDPLTSRERQIAQLVSEGQSSKEIASILDISAKTVESHRTHIMRKLDVHSTASLVRYAIRQGLVQA